MPRKQQSIQHILSEGLTVPTAGDKYQARNGAITSGTINSAIDMGVVGTAYVVEIINNETITGRDMTVSFNAAGNSETTIKAGEATTFDKLSSIKSIFLGNGSGSTVNYRIRIYGVTG